MWCEILGIKKIVTHSYANCNENTKANLMVVFFMLVFLMPEIAFAQEQTTQISGGAQFFCFIAKYFKSIIGAAAILTVCLWALEHIFGMSKIHDLVIKVGTVAAVVSGGTALIANSGLTSSCVLG